MPSPAHQDQQIQLERRRTAEIRRQRERQIETHVQAIKTTRGELETKLRELLAHCEGLTRAARRLPAEEGSEGSDVHYRLYHTAHSRLAAAMGHALKRAQATDRLLEASREEQQDQARQRREEEVRDRVQAAVQEVVSLQLPKDDDFELLFGAEVSRAS